MSNALAVPTVTAAITALIQAAMNAANFPSTPAVAPGNLDGDTVVPRVVVHLYNVERNADRDNADLPTRSAAGVLINKPRTALRLHYLLAFRGSDLYESQHMLAIAAVTLHATPVLSRTFVASVAGTYPAVLGNDLASAEEVVRITPEQLSSDELSRLWALYDVGLFCPTLAYAASPVIVEADESPTTALPVAAFAVGAGPLAMPRLDAVFGPDGPGAPIRAAAIPTTLTVLGAALSPQAGETLDVRVDGVAAPTVNVVSDGELTVTPPTQVPGAHAIVVSRLGAPLDPSLSATRTPVSSPPFGYSVLPTIVGATATTSSVDSGLSTGQLAVTVAPQVEPSDRVHLLLDSRSLTPPAAVSLPVTVAAATHSIFANYADLPSGSYRVTLEINGVRSLPVWSGGSYQSTVVTV